MQVGQTIKVGNDEFEVVNTPQHRISCTVCEIVNCAMNKDWQEFKKTLGVRSCEQLIGVRKHFKKVVKDG